MTDPTNLPAVPVEDMATPDLSAALADAQLDAERLAAENTEIETADLTPSERRDALNSKRAQLDDARDRLGRISTEVESRLQAQLEETRRALEPLRKKAAEMVEQVEAISLYLGTDEDVNLIRDGEPAPAATPIHVVQGMRFMDEEMAIAAEAMGIEDATIDPGQEGWATFDEWLLEDPKNLRQVLPADRGVVAMRSARVNRSDSYSRRFSTDGSEVVHLLVVNGDKIGWVNAGDFDPGERLIPERDEFDRFFQNRDGTRLAPGSHQYTRAMENSEKHRRRFLKIALVLQGILDRHTLLGPLPVDDLSVVDPAAYDNGHIVLILDNEATALGSGIREWPAWRAMIGRGAEPGQRVVLGHVPGSREDERIHPRWANNPPIGEPLELKRRKDGSFYVAYPRTDKVLRRNVPIPDKPGWVWKTSYEPATSNATCTVDPAHDDFLLPIDHPDVTPEIIEWFLTSRDNRRHFQATVPLLRGVRHLLQAEAEAEEPFLNLAAQTAGKTLGRHVDEVEWLVADTMRWWKNKNRQHRTLVDRWGNDSGAFNEIVAETERRAAVLDLEDDPKILAAIDRECPNAIWVGRRHDRTYVAITPHDDRDIFVTVSEWTPARGNRRPDVEWVTKPDVRAYKTIRSTDRHDRWPRYTNIAYVLTGPEIEAAVTELRDAHPDALAIELTERDWLTHPMFKVWAPNKAPKIPRKRPLTGVSRKGDLKGTRYYWTRSDGMEAAPDWRNETTGFPLHRHRKQEYVWVDTAAMDSLQADWGDRWEAHEERVSALQAKIQAATSAIEKARLERVTEAEYRSFVEKFGRQSIDRWEGHKKSITRTRLSWPHTWRPITELLDRLVETTDLPCSFDEILAAAETHSIEHDIPEEVIADLTGLTWTPQPKEQS